MPYLGIFRGLFTTNAVGTAHPDTDLWPPTTVAMPTCRE